MDNARQNYNRNHQKRMSLKAKIRRNKTMAYNNLIRANDPMAINMLKENLAHFENNIAYMQAVNDYYKANGTMVNFEGIDYAEAVRLDERVINQPHIREDFLKKIMRKSAE